MNPNTTATSTESLFSYMDMGTGFLIGLAIGYTIKKSLKLMLLLIGLGMIGIFVLESNGYMTINEAHVTQTISYVSTTFQDFVLFLKNRLELFQVSKGLSAAAGFIVGIKIG